jgi:hypothetical protein
LHTSMSCFLKNLFPTLPDYRQKAHSTCIYDHIQLIYSQLTTILKAALHHCMILMGASGMKICVQTGNQSLHNLIWRFPLRQWKICWTWMKIWWDMYAGFDICFPSFFTSKLKFYLSTFPNPCLSVVAMCVR